MPLHTGFLSSVAVVFKLFFRYNFLITSLKVRDQRMKRGNKDFLRDILMSADTNCVLKIKIKNVVNPIITAVDKITENEIFLKPTCLYGFVTKTPLIQLSEIESVIRYHTKYSHPLFVKMRYIKKNIAAMRINTEPFNYEAAT